MRQSKVIVEQVLKDGSLIQDADYILTKNEILEKLRTFFPYIINDKFSILCKYNNLTFAIRIKNITYLGNPHPVNKKRIQISPDLYTFYDEAKNRNYIPLLLGIYSYKDNCVFVDFKIDDFINKKAHNSSAHVLTEDLAEASYKGYYQKFDNNINCITAFRFDCVEMYFQNLIASIEKQKQNDALIQDFLNGRSN